jgi:hypothetical protein
MATYTITTISLKERSELIVSNQDDLLDENACGKTFTGFILLEKGSFAGAWAGTVDGLDVIFYADEVAAATPE